MECSLYKAVLFPLPTHSEAFLCFCCFPLASPIYRPFLSFYSYCCCVLLPSLASSQDLAELGLSIWTVFLSETSLYFAGTQLHQSQLGARTFSTQILRPSASGSKVSHRVEKSMAQHLAYVSHKSHTPGFTLQAYIYKKRRKHKMCNTGLSLLPKHRSEQLMQKRENDLSFPR